MGAWAEMAEQVNRRVGDHLRRLRKQKGLSLLDVEATSDKEFKASVLGAYERGARTVYATRRARLAGRYRRLPPAPTHVQIIPRTHVAHIADFEAGRDTPWLVELIEAANEVAKTEGLDKGYRLVFNNGPLAGQSVFHVHLHVLGGRGLGWPPG